MARRKDHTRKELNQMAINAALEIIEKEGLTELSTRKVAQKIGYSVGTLYNLFDNYEDLILQTNIVILKELYHYLDDNMDDEIGVEAIKKLAYSYIDYSFQFQNKYNSLFDYQRPPDSEMPTWYLEKVNRILDLPGKYLLVLLGGDDKMAMKASRIIWGSVHGMCTLARTHRLGGDNPEILKAMADSLIENYLTGLNVNQT